MESYPEQVIFEVELIQPTNDVVCIQMIQEVYENGEINVSEGATFKLVQK